MREEIEVYIELMDESIELPTYANEGDAGMDIRASQDVTVHIGETVIIPTGLKMAIPDGFEVVVRPRSGLSINTPLRIPNSPGTIDAGYRNEVGIIMTNTSSVLNITNLKIPSYLINEKGNKDGIYEIKKGDRVAQIVLQRVPKMKLTRIECVKSIGNDRNGGYGSSGTR